MVLSDDVSTRTLCVILHYGSEADTNNCLESLVTEENIDIVVADNDPTQSYLPSRELQAKIKCLRTGSLAGFSEGNNIAVRALLGVEHDSILFLNNDTIVKAGAIGLLRSALLSDGVGAVGPCMPYASDEERIWACGGFINKLTLKIGGLQPRSEVPYQVDYLPGAAILCRAEVWAMIGGLSEDYFLAYEEAEFALEVANQGFKVMAVPKAVILHKVGISSQVRPELYYNDVRNRLIFAKYLYGPRIGFLYGVLVTVASSLRAGKSHGFFNRLRMRFRMSVDAISDEASHVPLDREVLNRIALRYIRL